MCSHILAEMEAEATDYAIIDRGHLLKSGSVAAISDGSSNFKVEAAAGVTQEQVSEALKNAGIQADVASEQANLAKLYRDVVSGK